MATNATWTVIFDDKTIIKKTGDAQGMYEISDDSFWNQSKFSNIWAIQYGTSVTSDEVEHKDNQAHNSFTDENIGDFQQFIDKWDAAHLAKLQSDWDQSGLTPEETDSDKTARIGARPTSYSS